MKKVYSRPEMVSLGEVMTLTQNNNYPWSLRKNKNKDNNYGYNNDNHSGSNCSG